MCKDCESRLKKLLLGGERGGTRMRGRLICYFFYPFILLQFLKISMYHFHNNKTIFVRFLGRNGILSFHFVVLVG